MATSAWTGTNPMITLVPANLRLHRRILSPFSACGMPRVDIGPAEVYGFRLAGNEASVPRLLSRNH
ncbi:MAG: hypothetical protein WBF43_11180 [Methylocella sp.]